MFSSAFKSIASTNITANYSISPTQTSTAGPWKIYDAKKKSTGKAYSVFVFDRKSLDAHASGLGRSGAAAFKKAADEVVERLRKEASALARLRHPSVLELVEPVEDTRGGGLQFVTEAVTASLASLLRDKDEQERAGGRSSRYVAEEADGTRRRRELEIDELEIQKGLLQVSKALEFLHDNAGLVHGNLTPDAVLINVKSDWKLSGLAFCGPPENSSKPTSFPPVNLYEVLHVDTRLPRSVQLNLDYTSPDFVLDNNLTTAADMFSLGLLCVALYNSPHRSPLECHGSISNYKRLLSSPSSTPSPGNGFLSSRPLPRDLATHVLPRLVARRPAQRMTAREFQLSEYFDNILVSTIRFLDAFPAKTKNEKSQFLRGLVKVLPSFPKSVMEKKILPALLDEMKDRELISLILHNVFKIVELLPSGRRAFGERIRPALKEIFVDNAKPGPEKDPARDAGLMIVLEQLPVITKNCNGKEFKDDILPIIFVALEAQTPSLVDAALKDVPAILPMLDFSTIKNELFPVVASIFTRTNSLAIKVRGLETFVILCGGSNDPAAASLGGDDDGGLDGLSQESKRATSSSSALDKYTMQDKIVPLVKAIKTKEPAVMMAALHVLRVVGRVADAEFVATDILPLLWSMSLGPLLNLEQFKAFMRLIRSLSARVEEEQTKKLQELSGSSGGVGANAGAMSGDDILSLGGLTLSSPSLDANGTTPDDFERLVKGKSDGGGSASSPASAVGGGWDSGGRAASTTVTSPTVTQPPAFSWSTPSPSIAAAKAGQQPASFRTVTPDLGQFAALTPSTTQFAQPLQPTVGGAGGVGSSSGGTATSLNWGAAATNPWAAPSSSTASSATATMGTQSTSPWGSVAAAPLAPSRPGMPASSSARGSSFSLPPPPAVNTQTPTGTGTGLSGFTLAPPPGATSQGLPSNVGFGSMGRPAVSSMGAGTTASMSSLSSLGRVAGSMGMAQQMAQQQQAPQQQPPSQPQRSGLDKYASLL